MGLFLYLGISALVSSTSIFNSCFIHDIIICTLY
jgi:hypothetical protein